MSAVVQLNVRNGSLTVQELKKLTQCIREIEQNDTERRINVWINAPDLTVKELDEVLDSVKPGLQLRAVLKDGIHV